jgi:nitrite reductase (NADH) small subunit
MSRHIRLGELASIPEGEGRTFDIGSANVAVFRSRGGHLFATQAECPHRGGPLADGLVGGTTLICPLHEWTFDLMSGMAIQGECGIRTYPCRVDEDGMIVLDVEEDGAPPPFRVADYARFAE